jgi:hypothetical protein
MMEAATAANGTSPALELNEIQGNIVGFNKDHQRFVFLRSRVRKPHRDFCA